MTTVAIVDDETALTEILAELCELEKIDVVGIGHDGRQAVEICTKHDPDFLILDLSMPEFDGFYALEKLQNTTTKIVITTGLIEQSVLARLKSYSIFSIKSKPLKFDDLLKIIS